MLRSCKTAKSSRDLEITSDCLFVRQGEVEETGGQSIVKLTFSAVNAGSRTILIS